MGPLLNGAGDLVMKDTEKSEVLSIFSVFTVESAPIIYVQWQSLEQKDTTHSGR